MNEGPPQDEQALAGKPPEDQQQTPETPPNELEVLRSLTDPKEILAKTHELLKKKSAGEVFMATSEALINAGEVNLGAQFLLTAQKEQQLRKDQEVAASQEHSANKMMGVAGEFQGVVSSMLAATESNIENNRRFSQDVERLEEISSKNATTADRLEGAAQTMNSAVGRMEDSAQTINSASFRMQS